MAEQIILDFSGDRFVTRASQHIQHGLGADNLRSRCHQRREAQVLAYARDFSQHFIHAVQRTLFLELVGQVGNHAARHLIDQYARIDAGEVALELPVFFALLHGSKR